jgi:hypothetical protein
MFVNVRDFFNARVADFPPDSVGGDLFAALLLIIEQLGQLSAEVISISGEVAQKIAVKAAAKRQLDSILKDIAGMSITMAGEFPGIERQFQSPDNKSVLNLIASGRAFAVDAGAYKTDFIRYGLTFDFIARLTAATDALEAANHAANDGKQERIGKNAALVPVVKDGLLKVTRLKPIVSMKYRDDPANLSAWRYASHVEREPRPEKPEPKP